MATLYPDTYPTAGQTGTRATGGINAPPAQDFNTPALEGSMQQFLADNLGQYVVIEFLMGTQSLVAKAGVLYAVGTSVVTLYQELSHTFVTCDIFSIKFVTFYLPGHRPWQVNNPLFGMGQTAGQDQGQLPATPGLGQSQGTGWGTGVESSIQAPDGLTAPSFTAPLDLTGTGLAPTTTSSMAAPGRCPGCSGPGWG